MSCSQTEQLVQAFCDCTLPKAEWTHHAHLRVGLWHLLRYSPNEALDQLRAGICRYNLACGVANTETSGYHESITRFYIWAIAQFLATADQTQPLDELAQGLIQACGDQGLPFTYWSKERLLSVEARLGWVEPDRQPLAQFG